MSDASGLSVEDYRHVRLKVASTISRNSWEIDSEDLIRAERLLDAGLVDVKQILPEEPASW